MTRVITFNIDGLDPEVLRKQLIAGKLPELSKILGKDFQFAADLDVCSVAPSVTFAAQASIITGEHPSKTGMAGNHFLERDLGVRTVFGSHKLADVGNSLAIHGKALADGMLSTKVQTVFESLREQGKLGKMFHNIYGRGSAEVRPSAFELARFYALRKNFINTGQLDDRMVLKLEQMLSSKSEDSSLVMAYFLGLDKASHQYGPTIQADYLSNVIDRQVGRIIQGLKNRKNFEDTIFIIVSDHSQTEISAEGKNRLQNIDNWDTVLQTLNAEVTGKKQTKDREQSAIIGLNGGFAHVYIRNEEVRNFKQAPDFVQSVKLAAMLFDSNQHGKRIPEMQNTLDLILVRDGQSSWNSPYRVYCGHDRPLQDLETYFKLHPELDYMDAASRLNNLSCANSGDIVLVSNWREKHAFHSADRFGSHGGLSTDQSRATFVVAKPGADYIEIENLNCRIRDLVSERAYNDSQRMASIVDYAPVVKALVHEYLGSTQLAGGQAA